MASSSNASDHSLRTLVSRTSPSPDSPIYGLEEKYMELIQSQIQPFFPKFAASLAEQSSYERERGRCAVLDFSDPNSVKKVMVLKSADLDPLILHGSRQIPCRRLFLLEDLPSNHVLTLGAHLRIPPSFFAGHWDDPANPSTFNHRNPFQRASRSQFRIRYANSNRVEVDVQTPASMYAFNTNVCRFLHTYTPGGLVQDEARSHHALSFWSSNTREDGSWDAVLLVDPPPQEFVRCLATKARVPLRRRLRDETSMPKHFLNPEIDVLEELSIDPSDWATAYTSPSYDSMFDDVVDLLPTQGFSSLSLHDPKCVTELPRKLAMSTLLAFIRRRYMNLVTVGQSQLKSHYAQRHNYL